MLYLLSSPYLLACGDDRIRSIREQMMLTQVVLVELSHGDGIAWEFYVFMCFMILISDLNYYKMFETIFHIFDK